MACLCLSLLWLTRPRRYDPTIEDSYSVTRTIDGRSYLLCLTDTAGQEEYRSLWTVSSLRSDAFLLVYDITKAATLAALDHFATLIDMEMEQRFDRGAVPPVRIVAGNKCDLQGQRQVRAQEGLEWARRRRCGFMETSARDMVNVEETFACKLSVWLRGLRLSVREQAAGLLTHGLFVVIVRRVVEARRLHAAGGPGHASAITQPLTPLKEKQDFVGVGAAGAGAQQAGPPTRTTDELAQGRESSRDKSWWRKVLCSR